MSHSIALLRQQVIHFTAACCTFLRIRPLLLGCIVVTYIFSSTFLFFFLITPAYIQNHNPFPYIIRGSSKGINLQQSRCGCFFASLQPRKEVKDYFQCDASSHPLEVAMSLTYSLFFAPIHPSIHHLSSFAWRKLAEKMSFRFLTPSRNQHTTVEVSGRIFTFGRSIFRGPQNKNVCPL